MSPTSVAVRIGAASAQRDNKEHQRNSGLGTIQGGLGTAERLISTCISFGAAW